jgi:hypothetical protein
VDPNEDPRTFARDYFYDIGWVGHVAPGMAFTAFEAVVGAFIKGTAAAESNGKPTHVQKTRERCALGADVALLSAFERRTRCSRLATLNARPTGSPRPGAGAGYPR